MLTFNGTVIYYLLLFILFLFNMFCDGMSKNEKAIKNQEVKGVFFFLFAIKCVEM